MTETAAVEPMKVHLSGSDLPLITPERKRCRRGTSLRTFVLTANDPVQQILPQNTNRIEAYIQCVDDPAVAFSIHDSLADAQAGGNAGVTVPAANTGPYPLHTNDAVWATAAGPDLPVTVSISAVIEADE